jgi:8-oxo-dGTP pyrophosphatase MutT (NUDIX family)
MPERTREIHIAAALLIGPGGRTLLVRKRGTTAFMQPGGKIDAGETPLAALKRELREELSLEVDTATALHLGRFEAPAAHETDAIVVAEVYEVHAAAGVAPQAEIEEIRWIDPAAPGEIELAPLTGGCILPAWRATRR